MSILKFSLVLTDRFLAMHVSMSLDIVGVLSSVSSSGSMASKRVGSKNTNKSIIGDVVE